MRVALALLLLLAGCDLLFQLNRVKPSPDAVLITEASVDAPPRCPLADNFDDGVISPIWALFDQTQTMGIVSEKNGQLDIAPRNDLDDVYNGVTTVDAHDLRNTIARVTVYPMEEAGWYELYVQIYLDDFNRASFQTGAGNLAYIVETNGVRTAKFITYDPAQHRHLQMRHDAVANLIHFEASGDSMAFKTLDTVVVPWSFSAVHVVIFSGTYQPGGPPAGSARFDDFTVCPP